MNLTEMEAKVREATNNEPWGASTTLMAQIAAGTYNYREREEIVGFIFRRFTEKAANEWRQIYKSLQLLEYLIKNGSERIIDDVRANLSLILMLKSFHYIDSKGRDQGINVRNRSKNLVSLLGDDALIRSERKKAKVNAHKFGGVSSAAFGGVSSAPSGRSYVGDDDDFTNRVYGDGGVYGERYDDPAAAYSNGNSGASNDQYEEYDVAPSASSKPTTGSSRVNATSSKANKSKPQPKQPEADLLGDLLDGPSTAAPNSTTAASAADDDDDDFDDFQAAPSQPVKPNVTNNLASLYQAGTQQNTLFAPQQNTTQFAPQQNHQALNSTQGYNIQQTSSPAVKVSGGTSNNDAFSSLFSSAKTKSKTTASSGSASNGGNSTPAKAPEPADDDFFGELSSNSVAKPENSTKSTASGEIDLLSF